ncbi:uncharacterized protein [Brachyistius frenatus]|uniref:uncharacterized protein n=1 Tax=Brachyistius frenatus TaxID=100188 RepID=UPI0037E90151
MPVSNRDPSTNRPVFSVYLSSYNTSWIKVRQKWSRRASGSILRMPSSSETILQFVLCVLKKRRSADTMNEVDYLQQHQTESVSVAEKLEMNRLGVHQPQDIVVNQTADVQQLVVIKEEVPHEWSPSLDQQDPELLHIKEEEEELWSSQEEEQLHGPEEDITRFPFTAVPVKSEDDEEKPQSSHLHQRRTEDDGETTVKTESDGEDCGGPEPDPNSHSLPSSNGQASDSSETEVSSEDDDEWQEPLSESGPETEDSYNLWKESGTPESGLDVDLGCNTSKKSQMEVHAKERPFVCDVCGQRFIHQQNVKMHMRIHTGEKPFGCEVCGKRFTYQQNLKTHMRIHTGEKPFVCDICGKRTRHQNNLKIHMMVHTGEKSFGCNACGKKFKRKTYLASHMIVHTGEKPFGCDDCGKRFKRKAHLTTHMSVHTGEKPFVCDVCGKGFNRKTHLRTHGVVHTGEKPFSCDLCGKTFNRKTHLETHVTVHTGEKPYGCAICGQDFTQQGSLNRHMRFHTG